MTNPHPRPAASMTVGSFTSPSTTVRTSSVDSNCRSIAVRPARIGTMTTAMTRISHDGRAAATDGGRR